MSTSTNSLLEPYKALLGSDVIDQLVQIASLLNGIKIVHVNSTREGGGVAEILAKMVPLMNALGMDTKWEVIHGEEAFFRCTKMMHNALQGRGSPLPPPSLLRAFEEINAQNAEALRPVLEPADIVFIHDPQPVALINAFAQKKGKWIWRCHVDLSSPLRTMWQYLRQHIAKYDASVFSIADFAKPLPHPSFLIPPSIDPFSDKNVDLEEAEIAAVQQRFGIDPHRPMILQVSRFDRFKDPLGVIEAYRLSKAFNPLLQLVLAGGGARDDPEGEIVLNEVMQAAKEDPDIHVLFLPSDSHREINALQRSAQIVLQKSIREGFGLTVTEALWKGKPVIGGNTGGIRHQVFDYHTGFLVNTPEGAANRIRYLLQGEEKAKELGQRGRLFVKENFMITRHLRDYLILMTTLRSPNGDRIEFGA